MKFLTAFALLIALTGCTNNSGPVNASPDYRPANNPVEPNTETPPSNAVLDPGRNSLNHMGTPDQNGGSTSPTGASGK